MDFDKLYLIKLGSDCLVLDLSQFLTTSTAASKMILISKVVKSNKKLMFLSLLHKSVTNHVVDVT
jgi:hypothetical protein